MLTVLFLLLLLIISGSWYAYRIAFFSPPNHHPAPEEPLRGQQYDAVSEHISRIVGVMKKYTFEEITILSQDGLKLYGRYYHFKDGAPIEIIFHGYRSHAFRDCSGGHSLARKIGYNVLVVDQRAQGNSEGRTITFGIRERYDLYNWVCYCVNRFGPDVKLVLSGLSMGAATVLMAADQNLPNVTCIIADSPYSTPIAIIEKVARDQHYPVALCRPFIHLGARLFGGISLNECSAKNTVQNAQVPILLIHGEDDQMVPFSMSLEIAACCSSPVQVATFPGAGHGLCYITDPIRYEKIVCNFLDAVPSLHGTVDKQYLDMLNRKP